MSRYEIELDRLATKLASMVADPDVVAHVTDTELVNRTRLALRWWCRRTLHAVAPVDDARVGDRPGLADLARAPLGVLHHLLSHDPTPVALATERNDPLSAERSDAQWRQLIHAVEFTMYEWDIADPASKPSSDRAWATVANVAAVAQAAASLDEDLFARSTSTTAAGRARDCHEIAVAAQHVRQIAGGAVQLPASPLRPAPHRLRPILVRGLRDVPQSMRNLSALIEAADHLGPGAMGVLATGHARSLAIIASLLVETAPLSERAARQQTATDLRDLAVGLVEVRAASRRLSSIYPDDPRPLLQMRELYVSLQEAAAWPRKHTASESQRALFASMRAALLVPTSLVASTEAQVREGHWLQPTDGDNLPWTTVGAGAAIRSVVAHAAVQGRALAEALPVTRPAPPPYRTPHERLSPVLWKAGPEAGIPA